MKKIINVLGWIVLLLAFAALGLNADNKLFGFFLYLVIFAIIFGLVYWYIKKHHRRTEIDPQKIILLHKILGFILLLVAVFSPAIALGKIHLPFLPNLLIFITTAVLIAAGVVAVTMINSEKTKNIFGYIILIILSAVPAFFATTYLDQFFPNTYNALGTAYWAVVSVAIFSWWGFSLYSKKE